MSRQILAGQGAYRVHGGGFAGTIQAFVPLDLLAEYKSAKGDDRATAAMELASLPVEKLRTIEAELKRAWSAEKDPNAKAFLKSALDRIK